MIEDNNNFRKLDEILSRLLVSAYKIEEKAVQKISDNGLTISEIHVLKEIPGERPKTMSMVADGLRISVGALTTAIDKLSKKGYVKRFRGKTDKRTMKVMLTPKGKQAYKGHDDFHKGLVEAATEGLDKKEKELLLNSLIRIDNFFEEESIKWK